MHSNMFAFMVIFGVIGVLTLIFALAANTQTSFEAEDANKSGTTVGNSSSASSGQYLQFGKGFTSECLARSGTKTTINGDQSPGGSYNFTPGANSIINATNATWTGQISWVITVNGAGPGCWYGGKFQGTWDDTDPSVTWQTPYHHSGAFTIRVPNYFVEGYRADNQGDGINVEGGGTDFHVRANYLSQIHDDCIQNDFLLNGEIEDSLFDGCYTGISEDDFTASLDGSANTLNYHDNLMYIKAMNTVYRGTAPGVGILFKGWYQSPSTKVVLKNNIFYAAQLPGFSTNGLSVPAGMDITDCSNNIFVWTGPGAQPPGNFPSCFTFTKDVSVWTNAVAAWKAAHPTIH